MSANPDLFWQLNIGDYLRDTQHLNAEEHGAYLLLLMHYWIRGPLPDDDNRLAIISRCSSNAWGHTKDSVLAFFEHREGRYYHKRVDRDRIDAIERMEKAAARAKAAAEARWGKADTPKAGAKPAAKSSSSNAKRHAQALPEDMLEECQTQTAVKRERATGATLIDPNFKPILTAQAQAIVDRWPDGMFEDQLFAFISHAQANARTQPDWQAAFRTWISNAEQKRKTPNGTTGRTGSSNGAGIRKSGLAAACDDVIENGGRIAGRSL